MFTDYHNHLLPGIDDGAKDISQTLDIIKLLQSQGIERVIATPHFYSHKEDIESFINRRQKSYQSLYDVLRKEASDIPIELGAEIYLNKGLCEIEGLKQLTLGCSRYMLIELPYSSYKDWMIEEIYNISFEHHITPVIAHFDRYFELYNTKQIEQILSIRGVIIQINNDALLQRNTLKFVQNLIRNQYPIVFGSDTHNMSTRKPNFDIAMPVLHAKLKKELPAVLNFNATLV